MKTISLATNRWVHRSMLSILLLLTSLTSAMAQQILTLEECRKLALEQNKQVRMADDDVAMAQLKKKEMETKYLPRISFNGGYLRTQKNFSLFEKDQFLPIVPYNTIDPKTGNFNPQALADPATAMNTLVINPKTGQPMLDSSGNPIFKNYAMLPADKLNLGEQNKFYAGFSLQQPIFMGLKIVEGNKMASVAANIAQEKVLLTKAEVLVQTDQAYWRAVSLQEKVKLAKSYEGLLDQLVTDLSNMYAEGIITNNDVLKAQVKQNEAKLKVLKAENGLALSKMALAQIIGMVDEEIELYDSRIDQQEFAPSALASAELVADNRLELSMLKEKLLIMESKENIERSKFMPNIFLTAGYGWMNPNPYNSLKKEFGGDWHVGVVVSIPLVTWGERSHSLHSAQIEKTKTQRELDQAREMIQLQVRQNQYKYTESIKKVELTKLSKSQAEENMRVTKEQLREGRVRLTDLLEAQVQWESAASEYIDALIEHKVTLSELEKATGEIYKYIHE
ncbi:TolC family protein [Porphyromonadaceae bacterium W3.11]|nr:TolC family protein [Porphyromonadaceae bacterium W3.11]